MLKECASLFCNAKFEPSTVNHKYHTPKCKRQMENVQRRRVATIGSDLLEEEVELIKFVEPQQPNESELITHLRSVNNRLAREVSRLKIEKFEFHEAFKDGAYHAIKQMNITPVPQVPVAKSPNAVPEVACAVLSDFQLGKVTTDYNIDVCAQRINKYMDKLFRVVDIQRKDHPVTDLHAWFLGDMIEGEAIFPSQAYHIETGVHNQVMRTAEVLGNIVLRRALNYFDHIHTVGIAGNHGVIKTKSEIHPETNADRLLYRILEMIFEGEDRISWDIPDGAHEGEFYTVDQIGDKKVLLLHGHQIGGSGAIPTIERKIVNWCMALRNEIQFDYIVMGHFHNSIRYTINDAILYVNGTTESANGWSVEKLAKKSRPCQYLLFMHPEHGVTAEYPIYLDNA